MNLERRGGTHTQCPMMEPTSHQHGLVEGGTSHAATAGACTPLHHDHFNRVNSCHERRGRGLLPLKKRRLVDTSFGVLAPPSSMDGAFTGIGDAATVNAIDPSVQLGGLGFVGGSCSSGLVCGGGGGNEKIAALALVAAASSGGGSSSSMTDPNHAPFSAATVTTMCSSSVDPYITASDASTSSTSFLPPSSMASSSRSLLTMQEGGIHIGSSGSQRGGFGLYQQHLQQDDSYEYPVQQQQQQENHPNAECESDLFLSHQEEQPQQHHLAASSKSSTGGNGLPTCSSHQRRERIHHPPLTSPLPGGCHGRTSRNNSYCRRTPRYDGSKYCKLHYQQFVLNGGGSVVGPDADAASPHDLSEQPLPVEEEAGPPPPPPRPSLPTQSKQSSSHHPHPPPHHHQNKRYTGTDPDEHQCRATTTRGRPCAYVAVGPEAKYCHLHADYDTNPPPRRGGCGGGGGGGGVKASTVKSKGGSSRALTRVAGGGGRGGGGDDSAQREKKKRPGGAAAERRPRGVSSSSSESSTATAGGASRGVRDTETNRSVVSSCNGNESKSTAAGGGGGGSVGAVPPAAGESSRSFPLLNSIPSDRWANKLVMITTGPLTNHTGRVVKWGNGWITVRTTTGGAEGGDDEAGGADDDGGGGGGGLLHNRRAIELYLLPDDHGRQRGGRATDGDEGGKAKGNGSAAKAGANAKDGGVRTAKNEGTASDESDEAAKLSQREISTVAVDEECRRDGEASSCVGGSTSSGGRKKQTESVIEEPTRPDVDAEMQGIAPEAKDVGKPNEKAAAAAESSAGSPGKVSAQASPSPKKSPSRRHMDSDVPLAEALSRAQEGGRLHAIDVLFGTAALERSRRTIHKPERYEDKAMIERKKSEGGQEEPMASPSRKKSSGGAVGGGALLGSPSTK